MIYASEVQSTERAIQHAAHVARRARMDPIHTRTITLVVRGFWGLNRLPDHMSGPQSIIAQIAHECGSSIAAIKSKRRGKVIIAARHKAIRAIKKAYPNMTTTEIAAEVCCSHSTVSIVLRGEEA